jgi:hypothetical protein
MQTETEIPNMNLTFLSVFFTRFGVTKNQLSKQVVLQEITVPSFGTFKIR